MSRALAAALAALAVVACIENPAETRPVDEAYFRCRVQPVLDQSCSAIACHGTVERPFHVFARNRLRLSYSGPDLILPLTDEELAANFENARGFVQAPPDDSWLVRKPLAQSAGGWFHLGDHLFQGGDVWLTPEDPDFITVLDWARGVAEDPDCVYAGSL